MLEIKLKSSLALPPLFSIPAPLSILLTQKNVFVIVDTNTRMSLTYQAILQFIRRIGLVIFLNIAFTGDQQ